MTKHIAFVALAAGGLLACSSAPPPVAKQAAPAKKMVTAGSTQTDGTEADAAFLVGGEPMTLEAAVRGYVEKRARVGESRNRRKTVVPFEIEKLPEATVKEPLKDVDAPKRVAGDWSKEVVAKQHNYHSNYGYGYGYAYNTVSVEGSGFTSGMIRIGAAQGMFYLRDGAQYGGLSVMCGPNETIQSARWEGLITAKPGEEPTYQIVDGWFDRKECKAVAVRRQTVKLKTIVADQLYGFRECEKDGCEGKVSAAFIIPYATAAVSQNTGAIAPATNTSTRIVVPVRKGSSESIMAMTYRPQSGTAYYTRTLSIEIVQGTADPKPFATAFLEDPK